MKPKFYRQLLAVCVASLMSAFSYGQENTEVTEVLPTIEVQAVEAEQPKTNVEQKTAKTIQQEMIRDTRDLVRYSPDVGVADNGRHLKGFAMRGVDGNRVGISIDGINIPDFEENSLYKRYGNFNNSRLSVDSEFVRTIDSVKGADSFDSGSGALGGTVNYKTLEANDLVTDGKFGGLVRTGYATKNNEWVNTLGLAYTDDKLDAILMYSQRNGHEMESAGGNIEPTKKRYYDTPEIVIQRSLIGASRIEPDPSKHTKRSYLGKLTWKINPNHRLGVAITGQDNKRFMEEFSYIDPTGSDGAYRNNDDIQKLLNTNLFYEWKADHSFLDKARVDLDYQRTENGTINYKGYYNRVGSYINGYYTTDKNAPDRIDFRNMKTDYKRITLGLDSQPFSLGGQHQLSFKTFLSQRDFENVNDDLFVADNKRYIYTIQRPASTRIYGLSLQDNIIWNDTFSSVLGVRYDHTKIKPEAFDVPCSYGCYRAEQENPAQVMKFSNVSWKLGLEGKINDDWLAGYNLSNGFRVPTVSELYFQYNSAAGAWKANPNLKAEKSLNHNLYLRGNGRLGMLDLNLYYSSYKDFLFEQETIGEFYDESCQPPYLGYICQATKKIPSQQMVNIDRAKIYGAELKSSLNLNEISPAPEGLTTSLALGYSQGKLSIDDDLFSIQPFKLVYGLDYEAPSGKWGLFSRVSYQAGKKANDAMYTEKGINVRYECQGFLYYGQCYGTEIKHETEVSTRQTWRWLSKSYTTIDLFGYYQPIDNVTLRAGVFNLTNRKYHTWDTLRGINIRGTTDRVDYEHNNQGLERFYAPERNYSMSIEYKF